MSKPTKDEIIGPSVRHFMDARAGRGTGFAICEEQRFLEWSFSNGKPGAARTDYRVFHFLACDRRNPKRICTALPVALFFLN